MKNSRVVHAIGKTSYIAKVIQKACRLNEDPAVRLERDLPHVRKHVIKTMGSGDRPRGGLYRPTLRRALGI